VTTIAFDSYWTGSKDCDLFSAGAFNLKTAKPERRLDREVDPAPVSSITGASSKVFANFTIVFHGLSVQIVMSQCRVMSGRSAATARLPIPQTIAEVSQNRRDTCKAGSFGDKLNRINADSIADPGHF